MNELLLILFSILTCFLMGLVPYDKIILKKKIRNLDKYLFNFLISISLILLLNLSGLKLQYIVFTFYFLLIISSFFLSKSLITNTYTKHNLFPIFFTGLINFIIAINVVYDPSISWEAQTIWMEKTIPLVFDQNLTSLKNSPAPELPILFPIIWSFFWKFFNIQYEYTGRIFLIFFYLISLFLYADLFKTNIVKKLIILLIIIFITFRIEGFQGDLEVFIFSIILMSMRSLYLAIFEKDYSMINIINFILLINLLIWSSNEGMFYAGFLTFVFMVIKDLDKTNKMIILTSYLFLLILKLSIFIYYDFGINLNSDDYAIENISKNLNVSNLILISKYLFFNILRNELILISSIFILIEFQYFKKNKEFDKYLIPLIVIFIYMFFLFNEETLEGILKHKMIPLLYFSSALLTLPIVNVINSILIKSK
tara:strand:+ start:7003 stop:8277 length:1275 start_codon:yes stop_codon:yes gene_type:complete